MVEQIRPHLHRLFDGIGDSAIHFRIIDLEGVQHTQTPGTGWGRNTKHKTTLSVVAAPGGPCSSRLIDNALPIHNSEGCGALTALWVIPAQTFVVYNGRIAVLLGRVWIGPRAS